VSRFI